MADEFQMLIDFSSPKSSPLENYVSSKPLIPCPPLTQINIIDNNPFDVMAHDIEVIGSEGDPFEIAFQSAICLESGKDIPTSLDNNLQKTSLTGKTRNASFTGSSENASSTEKPKATVDPDLSDLKILKSERKNILSNTINNISQIQVPVQIESPVYVPLNINNDNSIKEMITKSIDENISSNIIKSKIQIEEPVQVEFPVDLPLDINSDDAIKEVIAKRVTTCIQKALNSSQSHSDLRPSNTFLVPKMDKRSYSASNLRNYRSESPQSYIVSPSLLRKRYECPFSTSLQGSSRAKPASRGSDNVSFDSGRSFNRGFLAGGSLPPSSPTDSDSNLDDSVFLTVTEEVNREAGKLADIFKKQERSVNLPANPSLLQTPYESPFSTSLQGSSRAKPASCGSDNVSFDSGRSFNRGFLASGSLPPSSPTDSDSNLGDSVFLTVFEEVKREACKLADIFKKLARSYSIPGNIEAELDCEDLMSIEPVWDAPSFSEEFDDVGLPSIKLYHYPREKKTVLDSEALTKFKKRHRTSLEFSCLDTKQETEKVKVEGTTSESSIIEKSQEVDEVGVVPCRMIVPDCQGLKLKTKKQSSDVTKKGPLKAMVPLQKMTRKITEKLSSPLKFSRHSSMSPSVGKTSNLKKFITGKKDDSLLPSSPMAASTPQKPQPGKSSLVSTPKRLSRLDKPISGSIKRSSSANSKLISLTESVKVTPDTQMTPDNNTKKMPTRKSKPEFQRPQTAPSPSTNSRALSDLVTSGPQQNIRKTPNQFLFKIKKGGVAHQDKENQIIRP